MVHEEHCGLGDLGRPPVDLDAVEPVDGQLLVQGRVQAHGHALGGRVVLGTPALLGEHIGFDLAQPGVGDVEEVAAPAGGVHVDVRRHLLQQPVEFAGTGGLVADQPVRPRPVVVQE